jgi:hypothetical protein
VSFEALLEMALTSHDPFRPTFKAQYASLVLTHDEAQLAIAHAVAERLELGRGRKLATRIEPLKTFYFAEDYHQKYYLRSDRTLMADFHAMFAAEDAFRESTAAARVNGYVAGDGSRIHREAYEKLGVVGIPCGIQGAKVKAAGGSYLTGRKETNPNVYYEVKYTTPEGIVFDITESGWKGAVKEVSPTRAA